jgi:hypothetical protein
MSEKEYHDGDKVWFIPGYGASDLICVQVTLKRNTFFRDKYGPDGRLFYSMDEPTGNDEPAGEFFETLEDAKSELKTRLSDLVECLEEVELPKPTIKATLDLWREQQCNWLIGNHDRCTDDGHCTCGCRNILASLKPKTEGVEWFSIPAEMKLEDVDRMGVVPEERNV